MNVDSVINFDPIAMGQLNDAIQNALLNTAEKLQSVIRDAQVVPFMTGNLNGESFFIDKSNLKDNELSFVHSTPYARRLYYHPEFNFNQEFHKNAKGEWFEDWLPGGEKDIDPKLIFEIFMREEMKRFDSTQ